jgi:hypothetical protein
MNDMFSQAVNGRSKNSFEIFPDSVNKIAAGAVNRISSAARRGHGLTRLA